ncbi:MAG TPA: SulP family inorganic anion transporter, partial [Actinomycetota bacterium]|nr:SulP family inorganic anion transporter [Actinomycetota bacterium]
MSEQRRTDRWPASLAAGLVIGAVETLLATSFAAFVFAGYLESFLARGIGLYLGAAALTLAGVAWLAGGRGVIGGMQAAGAAVLTIVVSGAAITSYGALQRDFLTAVAATLVVTVLCGVLFLVLGTRRVADVIRFVPYPVAGGFLAGAGWLLVRGAMYVSTGESPYIASLTELVDREALIRWLPAVGFGVVLFLAARIVKRPLVIPAVLALGLVAFAIGMLVTGTSIETARNET